MQSLDIPSLTDFAKSLVMRVRAEAETASVATPSPLPIGSSPEALRQALVTQAETFATYKAKASAEVDTLVATLERLEVEVNVQRGALARVTSDHNDFLIEISRLRVDINDLGDALVGRLVAEFDRRTTKQL